MPIRRAKDFLRRHPPFSQLDDRALDRLIGHLRIQVFPAGVHILRQGAPAQQTLHVIKEGTVRLYSQTPEGREQVLDFRGPGDTFGFLLLGEGETLDTSVQAVSDTVCYVMDAACIQKLIEDHPEIKDYLVPAFFPKRETGVSSFPHTQSVLHEGSEKVLFTTPVEHLASLEVLFVDAGASILEASRLMSAHRVGALVVKDGTDDRPWGIVTTSDFRDRVLVAGLDPSVPVGQIVSTPLITVEAREFCFEALLKMMSHDVHHLPVMDGGKLVGIVSNHDFMVLQGTSPLVITREIEGRVTVEGLAASARRVKGLVSLLLREGAGSGSIIRVISAVNDRIERRILELSVMTLGPPPLPFCWIVYGSAGRKEQTFKTDQDNAIIYADPAGDREAVEAREYFSRFAEFVVGAFQRCGFARCQGNFMATNPDWRQPLTVWKRNFSSWIDTPDDAAIHNAANLFEFRGLHGDLGLAGELKTHLQRAIGKHPIFLKAMADLTVDYRPPLGFFGSLLLEKGGDHPAQIDLKKYCLTPLTNIVRLFSLESGLAETSTIERLAVLKSVHPVARAVADDLAQAFEFLSLLRIRHQHEQIAMDLEPDNFIDPRWLNSLELRHLKEICRMISRILDDISRRYEGGTRL